MVITKTFDFNLLGDNAENCFGNISIDEKASYRCYATQMYMGKKYFALYPVEHHRIRDMAFIQHYTRFGIIDAIKRNQTIGAYVHELCRHMGQNVL